MLFYMHALRRFVKQIWREPNTVMMASLVMVGLSLPVVSIGLAWCFGVSYMHDKEKGIGTSVRAALRSVKPYWGKALIMGIVDVCFVVACVSAIAWLVAGRDFVLTLLSTVFLYLALFYLATGIFRYPILTLNPGLSLGEVVVCAMSVTLKNFGYVLLYWCVALMALMICAVTGVGLVLLLPGCVALLMTTSWSESLKRAEHLQQQSPGA